MGNTLIIFGIVLVIVGLLFSIFGRFDLPGDIKYERGNFRFYFPLASSIIISIVLTLLFNLFGRR